MFFYFYLVMSRCSYFSSSIISDGGMPKVSGKPKEKAITKIQDKANVTITDIPIFSIKVIIGGMRMVAIQLPIEVACRANDLIRLGNISHMMIGLISVIIIVSFAFITYISSFYKHFSIGVD
jgi:hypothetical protein